MTIAQYAAKWAVVEHKAEYRNKPLWSGYDRQQIFFNWAVDDADSPIRKAIDAGANEEDVHDEFDVAFEEMMSLLARMEGYDDRGIPGVSGHQGALGEPGRA